MWLEHVASRVQTSSQLRAEGIPLTLQELSASGDEFSVSMSVVEIYCERIRSALAQTYHDPPQVHARTCYIVQHCKRPKVTSFLEPAGTC